jgi:hypothetical protein
MENNWLNSKRKLLSLIIGEILLLVFPPLSIFSNPAVILAVLPGLIIGFFHTRIKNKRGPPKTEKVKRIARWLGIVFAIMFGIFVLAGQGTHYLSEIGFYYGLWQVASFYYGILWLPYLIGLNLIERKESPSS